jgi:hypothetical protein
MNTIPTPPPEAIRAYLEMPLNRPGRTRLFANGYERYGTTLKTIGNCTSPLIFEDEFPDGELYGIAGTCFLVCYRNVVFVITAQHCLTPQNGNDVRIALNPETKSFLPLKQLHRAISNPPGQDFADLAVFEAAPELLEYGERAALQFLALDPLRRPTLIIEEDAKLVVPGFPKYLNEVDYNRFVLHTQRYLPSGNYRGPTDRVGVHAMEFDELEHIDWPDGMSGSPVLFVENHPEAHFFGFMGVLIKAERYGKNSEFIGADVLFTLLDQIVEDKLTQK